MEPPVFGHTKGLVAGARYAEIGVGNVDVDVIVAKHEGLVEEFPPVVYDDDFVRLYGGGGDAVEEDF